MDFFKNASGFQSLLTSHFTSDRLSWVRMVWIAAFALIGYVGICLLVFFSQERLIFFPQPMDVKVRGNLLKHYPDSEWMLKSTEGRHIQAFCHFNGPDAPILIYFGGNAEEVSTNLALFVERLGISVATLNYPGYGLSQGRPSEKSILEAADLLIDEVQRRWQASPGKIVLMGRSLGSGVALEMALRHPVSGIILVSPYRSMGRLARRFYPWLPTGLLLRHDFDAGERLAANMPPLLMLASREDEIIPVEESLSLFQAWKASKEKLVLSVADHNNLSNRDEFWHAIGVFLGREAY